jgi:4'-phosphopantetheinyl transferase
VTAWQFLPSEQGAGARNTRASDRFPESSDLRSSVHVVRVRLDDSPEAAMELLDAGERARAARFVFDRDRRRFVNAHAWVRAAIGRCLGRDPAVLRFATGPRGKPHLAGEAIDLRFNLSHAGERALIALTLARDVGVDIEEERPVEVSELASRFFSPAESRTLQLLGASERLPAFFRCWTRKEAFIKALGDGLSFPLDGFDVSLDESDADQLLRACRAAPEALQQWRILSLPVDAGYAAALAVRAGDWLVVRWDGAAAGA